MPKPAIPRDYLLGELRCAALRSRLVTAEIESIGTAVKDGVMTPDEGLMLLVHQGLTGWCSPRLADMFNAAEREAERQRWESDKK